MKNKSVLLFACGLIGLQAGCSSPREAGRMPEDFEIRNPKSGISQTPELPASVPLLLPEPPQPIYRNPKIGVIYLRAHQDEQGRLLGPQVMYEVTDPGGWNVDAVEQGIGYIPAVNQEAPAESRPAGADQAAHITITGLMDPADRAQAEAAARQEGGGRVAVFDDQAGWLILQKP